MRSCSKRRDTWDEKSFHREPGVFPPMIVMKFGGTSVQDAKAIDRVAQIVQSRLADRPVVVVSAMAKVSDSLLAGSFVVALAQGAGHFESGLAITAPGGLGADFED